SLVRGSTGQRESVVGKSRRRVDLGKALARRPSSRDFELNYKQQRLDDGEFLNMAHWEFLRQNSNFTFNWIIRGDTLFPRAPRMLVGGCSKLKICPNVWSELKKSGKPKLGWLNRLKN